MQTLPSAYSPRDHEPQIYKKWEKSGYFNPNNLKCRNNARTYCIMMPPPNVTGTLHIGHAGMLAYEDILIRYHRMKGDRTLWLPGTDHAAIATQTKVEKVLKKEGTNRHKLGRKAFLDRVEVFTKESHNTIVDQIKKMGSSCDWSREAYTLDETRHKAVYSVFKMMYDDGLIYRGERIVNWCPRCHSTLANDEVEYTEETAKLYWIKYGPFILATARPETKLGDTAVAVHPDDKRYKNMVNKEYEIPGVLGTFKIKVVADEEVNPKFGSGAIKITPAHSFADNKIAQKHNLPSKKIIDEDGKMMKNCGKYAGMPTKEAREAIVKDMAKMGIIDHIDENYKHNISRCYRCDTPIEPLPSLQWFIDVNKKIPRYGKSIKELSVETVRKGVFNRQKIKICPKRFEKNYFHWMENLQDWCVSRQIWFGHRIPVWYKESSKFKVQSSKFKNKKEIYVGIKPPTGKGWVQDKDTLDTWFSSGLWTFSTLADSPNQISVKNGKLYIDSQDFKDFHPTQVLETGYDILFFWIARMIIMTTYALGDIPFYDVYLHGLVLDKKGKKMSKSKGNVVDPLDLVREYGADATRLSLVIGSTPGTDMRLAKEKIEGYRNLANKLWNIGRYILQKTTPSDTSYPINIKDCTSADAWILKKMGELIKTVEKDIQQYRFSQAGEKLREFMWDDLADWYIEASKYEENVEAKNTVLVLVFKDLLKLWHPYIPFVTETLWVYFDSNRSLLMASSWPSADTYEKIANMIKNDACQFILTKKIITAVRSARSVYRIKTGIKLELFIYAKDRSTRTEIEDQKSILLNLRTEIAKITLLKERRQIKNAFAATIDGIEIFLPLKDAIDINKERKRLQGEYNNANKYLQTIERKLQNRDFTRKAPKKIIESEKTKLKHQKLKINKIKTFLSSLE